MKNAEQPHERRAADLICAKISGLEELKVLITKWERGEKTAETLLESLEKRGEIIGRLAEIDGSVRDIFSAFPLLSENRDLSEMNARADAVLRECMDLTAKDTEYAGEYKEACLAKIRRLKRESASTAAYLRGGPGNREAGTRISVTG